MKKTKIKKKDLITIAIIVVILVIILLAIFLFKGQKLDANSSLVNNLYNYLGSNDLEVCNGLQVYSNEEVNYDVLGNETKLCTAYRLLDEESKSSNDYEGNEENTCSISDNIVFATNNYEDDVCTVEEVSKDELNNTYKQVFGKDISEDGEFLINYNTVCYNSGDNYYCGLAETYTKTFGAEPHTYRTIKDAYKKGDEIVIYDYFLKIVNGECYSSYVNGTTNNNCTNELPENEDDYNIDYDFLRKYGTLYKHTFKQYGDTYYWVSSIPE